MRSPSLCVLLLAVLAAACGDDAGLDDLDPADTEAAQDDDDDDSDDDDDAPRGEVDRAEIGPDGGRLEVGGAVLEVPAGALDETLELSMAVIEPDYDDPIASTAVELLPHGLQFAIPATLSLTVHGDDPEAPYIMRGEDDAGPFDPIASIDDGDTVTAELASFSVYFIGDGLAHRFTPQFESEGVAFTSLPVDIGLVDGPGAPVFEARDIGTGQGQGKLWFGRDRCVGFAAGGVGKMDDLGGTQTEAWDFPRLPFGDAMGRTVVPEPWEPEAGLLEPLHPEFARSDAVRSFQWGVALDEEGRIDFDYAGSVTIGVRIDGDDSVATGSWNGTDEDAGYGVTIIGSATTLPPSDTRYCAFTPADTQVIPGDPGVCLSEPLFGSGSRVVARCFYLGHLDGDYRVLDQDTDELLVSGQFDEGVPVGAWMTVDGTARLTGSYANGQRVGPWERSRRGDDGQWHLVSSFTMGGTVDGPLGPYEPADGQYEGFSSAAPYSLEERGSYTEGLKTGHWFAFDSDGTLESVRTWDADNPEVTGEACATVDDEYTCVDRLESRLTRLRTYDWGECQAGVDFVREVTYDLDGNQSDPICFEIFGDPAEPEHGAERSCPVYCDV